MSDSKRLRILKKLSEQLSAITHANGYRTEVRSVRRGVAVIGRDEPLPCITILESPKSDMEPFRADNSVRQKDMWLLFIQGFIKDDFENPTDPAHDLLADIKKCLSANFDPKSSEYSLGGLAASFRMEPGVCAPPGEISPTAYCWLRLEVGVAEDLRDP